MKTTFLRTQLGKGALGKVKQKFLVEITKRKLLHIPFVVRHTVWSWGSEQREMRNVKLCNARNTVCIKVRIG